MVALNLVNFPNKRRQTPEQVSELTTNRLSVYLRCLNELDAAGVPAAPIENVAQVIASKQTEELGILLKDPQNGMTFTGLPLEFDGARPPVRFSAPTLGEHNDILSEQDMRKKVAS